MKIRNGLLQVSIWATIFVGLCGSSAFAVHRIGFPVDLLREDTMAADMTKLADSRVAMKEESLKLEEDELTEDQQIDSKLSVKLLPLRSRGKMVAKSNAGVAAHNIIAKSKNSALEAKKDEVEVKAEGFTVQVASETEESTMNQKIQYLKTKKIGDLWVMKAVVGGLTRFRICSGRFETKAAALTAKSEIIKNAEFKDAFIQKAPAHLSASDD